MLSLLLAALIVSPLLHINSPQQLDFFDGMILGVAKKYPVWYVFFVLSGLKFRVFDFFGKKDEEAAERVIAGFSNPEKIFIPYRVIRLLLFAAILSFYFASMFFGLAGKVFHYTFLTWLIEVISACDPLPRM